MGVPSFTKLLQKRKMDNLTLTDVEEYLDRGS